MRYTSDTIRQIVTSESALLALERISPIYAEAENFLYLLQAIGSQVDVVVGHAKELQQEFIPQTTKNLIPYWERSYGLSSDIGLSYERRRAKVLAKIRSKPPMNPYKLAEIISAEAGCKVVIRENVAKNTFSVFLYVGDSSQLINGEDAVRAKIERVKPAHVVYTLAYSTAINTNLYAGGVVRTSKIINMKQQDGMDVDPDNTSSRLDEAVLDAMILG